MAHPIFIVLKYDSTGNEIWAKAYGGKKNDFVADIATDKIGDIYIIGGFESSAITFGGTTLKNSDTTRSEVFVAKLIGDCKSIPKAKVAKDTTICLGGSCNIGSIAVSGSSYNWVSKPAGFSSTLANPYISPTQTTVFYLIETIISTGCNKMDSVKITLSSPNSDYVYFKPSLTVNFIAKDTNLASYLWDFDDGGYASISNIKHTYLNKGSYTIILKTIDSKGCSSSTSKTLNIVAIPYYKVSGKVTTSIGASLKTSKVYLLKFNSSDTTINEIDKVLSDTLGNYSFYTQESSIYLYAWPDSAKYPTQIPTWYDTAVVYRKAKSISLKLNTNIVANFSTLAGTNQGGKGFIGGKITKCTGCKQGSAGKPIPNFKVLLYDANSKVVAYAITDTGGNFSFKNLATNSYKIYVDKPLIDNTKAPQLQLTSAKPKLDSLIFVLYADRLEQEIVTKVSEEYKAGNYLINISPNPFTQTSTLSYKLQKQNPVQIQLIDMLGRTVSTLTNANQNAGEHSLNFSAPNVGVYFLRIAIGDEVVVRRVVMVR
ncbi:MAG: PKD domain-containing protein [Bacteroidetes bacterium]|nr:PKD domain-containing protein [Bacteroidota bacterium]